jgi:hypothetical protein
LSKVLKATAAIALIGGGAAAAWHFTQNTVEKRFIAACIETIKERLRSPSSFHMGAVRHFSTVKPTMDDYFGWTSPEERKKHLAKAANDPDWKKLHNAQMTTFNEGNPKMLQAFIEYEAANTYGTMLKDLDICTYIYFDEGDPLAMIGASGPRINGDTTLEWSIKGVQN